MYVLHKWNLPVPCKLGRETWCVLQNRNGIFPTSELSFTRGFMNELMTDWWRIIIVFHSTLKLELCRHACRRRDPIISTCRYGKNMPTTALWVTIVLTDFIWKENPDNSLLFWHESTHLMQKLPCLSSVKQTGACLILRGDNRML